MIIVREGILRAQAGPESWLYVIDGNFNYEDIIDTLEEAGLNGKHVRITIDTGE